jgi:hypothetical protein
MLDRNLLRRIAILEVGLNPPEADCPEPRQFLPQTPATQPTSHSTSHHVNSLRQPSRGAAS